MSCRVSSLRGYHQTNSVHVRHCDGSEAHVGLCCGTWNTHHGVCVLPLRLSECIGKSQFPKLFVCGKLKIKQCFICGKEADLAGVFP